MTHRESAILSELRCRTTPIAARDLAPLAGCDTRRIRKAVDQLQRDGHKILSDARGYWLARTEADADLCRRASRTRIAHAIEELRDGKRFAKWASELESRQMCLEASV